MAPTVTPFGLGLRGTGSWVDGQMPRNFRDGILFLYPNGMAPLTAMLAKLKSSKTDNPKFEWFEQTLPVQGGSFTATDVYEDAAFSDNTWGATAAAGTLCHVKVAAAVAQEFRIGHIAMLRDASDVSADIRGKVTDVNLNGASSRISIRLLEAATAAKLAAHDYVCVIGNSNPEGGVIPDTISYDPNALYNYTQIFRTPMEITRTASLTRLRTGDAKKEMMRQALELHSIEMEKAFWFGLRSLGTGSNGQPERTTGGIIKWIQDNASTNCFNFYTDSDYDQKTWVAAGGGMDWLNESLEQVFRYGRPEKLAFCGSGALLGIQRLAETFGSINIIPGQTKWGINVRTWETPFGTIHLKTHPLFSYNAMDRNRIVLIESENLVERYITQTKLKKDNGEDVAGWQAIDGTKQEYLTETGLEIHHAHTFAILDGVGLDNPT